MSTADYFEGFEQGIRGFRLKGKHEVPREHPHGSTIEGRDWFQGFNAALEQCASSFRGMNASPAITTESAPRERQLNGARI